MKIAYCIAGTCHSGGMERVLANKANYLVGQGYEVIIITTDQHEAPSFFPLDKKIRCYDLGINYEENNGRSFFNKLVHYPGKQWRHKKRLTALLKREKPDITISMFCNDVSFMPHIKDGSKKILEIHFSKYKRIQYGRKGLWKLADRWFSRQDEKWVRRFDKFVVLTEEDRKYWGNLDNITVIPNARTFTPIQTADMENKKVIAVGRYTYQKGFERLIEAWHLVASDFPDWKLEIVGDGEQRTRLKERIARYGIDNSVVLVPANNEIEKHYLSSSVYAMTSRYEGLPMVLLEAQAFGLPIVSFNCKCGPSDVVNHGKNGFLVEEGNASAFASQLRKVMADVELRKKMSRNALEASKKFSMEPVMSRWMQLFESLTEK